MRPHPTTRSLTFALCALAVGCSTLDEVDDPALRRAGKELGQAAAALMEMPADAGENLILSRVAAVGEQIHACAVVHEEYLGRTMPGLSQAAPEEVETVVSWDGRYLVVDWVDVEAEFPATYDVDLRVRDRHDDSSIEHDAPVADRTFRLQFGIARAGETFDLDARFVDLTLDGDGCAAGGSIEIDYRLPTSGPEPATELVVTEFHGCGRIRVLAD